MIYPVGQVSTNIATPNTPAPPTDPAGKQIEAMGNTITDTALRVKHAADKRQAFIDDMQVSERYMNAVGDLETASEEAQKPEIALPLNGQPGSKKYLETEIAKRQPDWMKGLSPQAQKHLQMKLAPELLKYKINAARTENRALGDFADAQQGRMEKEFIDQFSRGNALNEKGQVVDTDGRDTEQFKLVSDHIDAEVRLGHKSMAKGEAEKDALVTKAAYYRGYKLVNSESEADLIQYQKLYQKESEEPGSTFLKNVDPDKRDSMNRTSHIRQVEMREKSEALAQKKLKEESEVFASRAIRSFNSKDPKDRITDAQFEQGLTQYESVLGHETVDALIKKKDEAAKNGGITNWDRYHQLKIDILAGDKAVSNDQIIRAPLASKEAEELIKLNERQVSEPGVEKTPFYKEGKEHIRTLVGGVALPGMEWMMKPVDRQRYSDALLQFNQYARKVFAEGDQQKISELPTYARNLAMQLKKSTTDSGAVFQEGDQPQSQDKPKKDSTSKSKPSWAK